MTTDAYASVNGERVTRVNLTVGNTGAWVADVDFEGNPDVSGAATLAIDTLTLRGTIMPSRSGEFGLKRRARIVAGAGAWGSVLGPKQYHNDAGVKAQLVAADAARELGETLGTFVPTAERVGRDYVREQGAGSRVLEDVIGGAPWWVDYDGITRVGPRASSVLAADAYQVLAFDPRDRIAVVGVDDPGAVRIGSILSEGLDGPYVVRSFEVRLTGDELRVHAWVGGTEGGVGGLAGLFRAIVERATDRKLFGSYRYRVVRMAGERVELQAARKAAGLPDLLPLSTWPGIAGAHAQLTPGAEVLVTFLEGDRAQPVVVAFAGPDAPGFVPVALFLGGKVGAPAARQGDIVECTLPPATFSGTVGGSPATGLITFTPAKAIGIITSGSSRVKVAP